MFASAVPSRYVGRTDECLLFNTESFERANTLKEIWPIIPPSPNIFFGLTSSPMLSIFHANEEYLKNQNQQNTLSCNNESITISVIRRISDHDLAQPITVTISQEEEYYFVENSELNIWGEGSSLDEAMESLKHFFLYDYESLKKNLNKLDHLSKATFNKYKSILGL